MLRVYVLTMFWISVLCSIIRMCELVGTEFPERKTKTLGEHLFELILGVMFTIWAGVALWGSD